MDPFTLQTSPFIVPTHDGKYIAEHFGLATDGNQKYSIAHMIAPPGWSEPFQTPEFEEVTLVLRGRKRVVIEGEVIILERGHSIRIQPGIRVQYANPFNEECEYVSFCTPAFNPDKAHREAI